RRALELLADGVARSRDHQEAITVGDPERAPDPRPSGLREQARRRDRHPRRPGRYDGGRRVAAVRDQQATLELAEGAGQVGPEQAGPDRSVVVRVIAVDHAMLDRDGANGPRPSGSEPGGPG